MSVPKREDIIAIIAILEERRNTTLKCIDQAEKDLQFEDLSLTSEEVKDSYSEGFDLYIDQVKMLLDENSMSAFEGEAAFKGRNVLNTATKSSYNLIRQLKSFRVLDPDPDLK